MSLEEKIGSGRSEGLIGKAMEVWRFRVSVISILFCFVCGSSSLCLLC